MQPNSDKGFPNGQLSFVAVRVGQSEQWRDHWLSLALDIGAEDTLDAVQMAARLLRCRALIVGLETAVGSGDGQLKTLATAVLRRWLLTLQAMAWLEAALLHSWSDIRPKELCCFALNSTKPDWPRRVVAISHRSQDVKPVLRDMHAWRAGRIAIDANYVPSSQKPDWVAHLRETDCVAGHVRFELRNVVAIISLKARADSQDPNRIPAMETTRV